MAVIPTVPPMQVIVNTSYMDALEAQRKALDIREQGGESAPGTANST